MSALEFIVYGALHAEPIAITKEIKWFALRIGRQMAWTTMPRRETRVVFMSRRFRPKLKAWNTVETIRISAIAYSASRGYSKPQLYPTSMLPW